MVLFVLNRAAYNNCPQGFWATQSSTLVDNGFPGALRLPRREIAFAGQRQGELR